MNQLQAAFIHSYHQARVRFQQSLPRVQAVWPGARAYQYPIPGHDHLTIDWISAPALKDPRRCLVITTGQHGIEGIVGSAVLDFFIHRYLSFLDPSRTNLVLVHILNPWGMAYCRKTNPNQVDLNRNFFFEEEDFPLDSNPAVEQVNSLIKPAR
jgi:murein tripeptide amidase MpaA